MTLHAGSTLSLNRRDAHKKPGVARPLWRKRETVIHERIVQYTTVDADGTKQELVETERSQNEIVHLECKETGEFAHRESQLFEQLETFNDEVVVHEKGNEEYIHMKSKDDEYEHLESNMPMSKMQPTAEEHQEAQARAEAEAQAAGAAGGGGGYDPVTGAPYEGMDPKDQSQFSEEARLWHEAQEKYQQEHAQRDYKFDGGVGSPSQAEFDADAQRWWEEQQLQQEALGNTAGATTLDGGMASPNEERRREFGMVPPMNNNTPTPSQQAGLDEDAARWWSEEQKKQKLHESQSTNQNPASPSPLKFNISGLHEGDHGTTPFSPNDNSSYHPLNSNGTEKENQWHPNNNNQFPEQPETM